MPTVKEFLGVEAIISLQERGYTNPQIQDIAKTLYTQKKLLAEQEKKRLSDADKMDNDFVRFGAGIAKGAMEGVRGTMKIAEDAANFFDPHRKSAMGEEYSTSVKKMGSWIHRLEEYQNNYKSTIGDAWDMASFTGEAVGGFVDPINLIPIGTINTARRVIGFAVTGAMSGGVAAYGGDRNVVEGATLGAIAAPIIGETLHWGAKGIAKLWTKEKERRIQSAKTTQDFDVIAQDELFNNPLMQDTDGKINITPEHTDINTYASKLMEKESPEVRTQVMQDIVDGKTKSVIDDERFSDLREFYSYGKSIDEIQNSEGFLNDIGAELDKINAEVGLSSQNSIVRYNEMVKFTQSEIKNNPNFSFADHRKLLNAKFTPTKEEAMITNWVNDGVPVENRLAGWNVLYALEKDLVDPFRSPEEYKALLMQSGFKEEQASVFATAYANRDINIAKQYFSEKIQNKGAEYVATKAESAIAEQRNTDGELPGREDELPREDGPIGDDTQRGSSDELPNQQHQEQRLSDGERAVLDDGQDTPELSEDGTVSTVNEKVAGQQTTRGDGDGVSRPGSDTVVQQKDGDGTRTDVTGEVADEIKTEQTTKAEGITEETQEDVALRDGQGGDVATQKEETPKNIDLSQKEVIALSKKERKRINEQVDEILAKDEKDITEEDKEVLRHYSGNGGIESGTYGSLSEHYTPYETVRGIYSALERAGVPMKKALEPAVGSGNFVGHKPSLEWTTIDIDPKAHAINKILYPNAKHYNTSFENFKGGDFDAIISNVPFIETRGEGALKNRPDVKTLHDYYFVSAIDKVKDDGVVAFVTTRGVMDKADMKIRKELMSKSDVIGAYRLPEGTFSKNAHTDVGADVIFLKKRADGVSASGKQLENNEAFMRSTKTEDGIYLNEYFQKNPEKILGDMEVGVNKQFGTKGYVVNGKADYSKMELDYNPKEEVDEALHVKEEEIPTDSEEFWSYADEKGLETHGLDESGILFSDGHISVSKNSIEFSDIDGGAKLYEDITHTNDGKKIKLLQAIAQAGESNDAKLGNKLIDEYKKLYKTHPYADKSLGKLFRDIQESEKLAELGSYFDKEFNPAQIFESKTKFEGSGKLDVKEGASVQTRMMFHEDNKGVVDIAKGGEHIEDGDIYKAIQSGYSISEKGKVQNDILYFSGNIYEKIEKVNALMDTYKDDAPLLSKLEKQLSSLEEMLPQRKSIEEISIRGDEPWLLNNGLEVYPLRRVEKKMDKGERIVVEVESGYGKIFDNYLNSKALISMQKEETLTSYRRRLREANEEVQNVLSQIKEKVLGNEVLTKKIEDTYNKMFNGYVSPDYKKASYLIQDTLDSLAPGLKLRDNQVQWITRAVYEGKGINAHDVGGGKTLSGVVLAKALKDKGIAKKPLFVVPAKVIKNWEKEIKRAFPDAKIINLFNLAKATRAKKLYELGNNEADYVLISHEGFKELKLPWDVESRYVDELLSENLKTEDLRGRALAIQEEKIKKYKALLRQENMDKRITIDKLGIDAVFADEARAFKNVGVHSKLVNFKLGKPFTLNAKESGAVTLDSASAYDFRFKTRYISQKNNGRNVYMLDATPTPNKPMEIYTMLKHLDNAIFDEYGIHSDRDFANRYFEFGAKMNKKGDVENGLVYIKNAYELRGIMDRYVNRISMNEFKEKGIISLPDEFVNTHYLDSSDESEYVFLDIKNRLLKAKSDKTQRNKVMGIFSEGISASSDPRSYQRGGVRDFIDPTPENNKLEAVVQKVIAKRKENKRAGQIIFLDNAGHEQQVARDLDKDGNMYEPTLETNLHQEIKAKLVETGAFKPHEIAIISGKEMTDPKSGKELGSASGQRGAEMKQAIVDAYDKGQIKVIIGTTQSAGEGMNIQKFTTDIYHMDIPWTPAEIIQRNGRGVRFGNENSLVNTHYFFQAGTFDELMYRTITNKRGWNEALWDAQVKDKIEIVDEGSSMPKEEEFMLQMEKDPLKRRALELQLEYSRLEDELQGVNEEGYFLKGRRDSIKRNIEITKDEIANLKEKLTSDRPNKYLGELFEKIAKTKDKAKRGELQADYDRKLANSRANMEKMIEAKRKRIADMESLHVKTLEAIETNKTDLADASSKLSSFERRHIGNDGKIKTELSEEIC